jgi:hypothetical protein
VLSLNCIENWCRKVALSINAEKTLIVSVIRHTKIQGFCNPKLFVTELRKERQAFNDNICVGSYVDVATFASVYKTRGLADGI